MSEYYTDPVTTLYNSEKIILDLCGGSGAWSKPYKDAGYDVRLITLPEYDVRSYNPPDNVYGILAAPPCQCFSRAGARWWKRQDEQGKTIEAIKIFRACWQLCQYALKFWALENPPGRHPGLMPELPRPSWQFQPFYFGDKWHKQTYLWGRFNMPFPTNVCRPQETIRMPSGHTVGKISRMSGNNPARSITPPGFAKAFYEANK